jgi:CRISPR/Cas system CMR subunit Cmr6 (Cas7 group RAMP superfamily)
MTFDLHCACAEETLRNPDPNAASKLALANAAASREVLQAVRPTEKALAEAWAAFGRGHASPPSLPKLKSLLDALEQPPAGLQTLPPFSGLLRFKFKLARPVITKDDRAFYFLDNPVRKDVAFGRPLFAASSWKGCLRAAFRSLFGDTRRSSELRLFGSRKNDADTGDVSRIRGRLVFFSSHWPSIGTYVINPHDRRKKTGMPIYYETIPEGAEAWYAVLYCPWGSAALGAEQSAVEAAEDLSSVAAAVEHQFLLQGFGAKTSAGFGLARDVVTSGTFQLKKSFSEIVAKKFTTLSGVSTEVAKAVEGLG